MTQRQNTNRQSAYLASIKAVHTTVWAFFAGCVIAIPVASLKGNHFTAGMFIAVVLLEVAILLLNGWSCPLTSLAARFTDDRRDNFDIYLPVWLAKNNKLIFGFLFFAGTAFALVNWVWSLMNT